MVPYPNTSRKSNLWEFLLSAYSLKRRLAATRSNFKFLCAMWCPRTATLSGASPSSGAKIRGGRRALGRVPRGRRTWNGSSRCTRRCRHPGPSGPPGRASPNGPACWAGSSRRCGNAARPKSGSPAWGWPGARAASRATSAARERCSPSWWVAAPGDTAPRATPAAQTPRLKLKISDQGKWHGILWNVQNHERFVDFLYFVRRQWQIWFRSWSRK